MTQVQVETPRHGRNPGNRPSFVNKSASPSAYALITQQADYQILTALHRVPYQCRTPSLSRLHGKVERISTHGRMNNRLDQLLPHPNMLFRLTMTSGPRQVIVWGPRQGRSYACACLGANGHASAITPNKALAEPFRRIRVQSGIQYPARKVAKRSEASNAPRSSTNYDKL